MNKKRLLTVMGGSKKPPYEDVLVNTYGASEVWPLVDILSGTAIPAKVSATRNGVLTGWDLQNAASPVSGKLAPYSDGVNDFGDIQSAGLASIFDGAEGSAIIFIKTNDWTEVNQYAFVLLADGSNIIRIYIDSANRLSWMYKAGGTEENRLKSSVTNTGWMCLGLSWSASADEVKAFYNGTQEGATMTGLGTWAGALANAVIGSYIVTPSSNSLDGWLAYCAFKFGSVWTPEEMSAMYLASNPS